MCAASQVVLVVKNPPANAEDVRDVGSVPGLGRSPREGRGNSLQYFWLENSMDRGVWHAVVHGVTKSWTRLRWLSMHTGMILLLYYLKNIFSIFFSSFPFKDTCQQPNKCLLVKKWLFHGGSPSSLLFYQLLLFYHLYHSSLFSQSNIICFPSFPFS